MAGAEEPPALMLPRFVARVFLLITIINNIVILSILQTLERLSSPSLYNMTAAQRALSIPEIFLYIVDCINPTSLNQSDAYRHSDLLHLGLTCRAAWDLVVPHLWRIVTTTAIHRHLPEELHGAPRQSVRGRSGVFASAAQALLARTELEKEDLAALTRYSIYWRELELHDHQPWRSECWPFAICLAALPQLARRIPALTKLDRVCIINRTTSNPELLVYALRAVIRPSVRSLRLELGRLRVDGPPLFTTIAPSCSRISELSLSVGDTMRSQGAASSAYNDLIKSCILLKTLRIDRFGHPSTCWGILASLPALENVYVTSVDTVEPFQMAGVNPTQAFQHLQSLTVLPPEPDIDMADEFHVSDIDTASVIAATYAPVLSCIHFSCSSWSNVFEIIPIIAERWSSTLEELDIRATWHWDDLYAVGLAQSVRELYPCSHLRALGINGLCHFDLQETDIETMTHSFPHMKRLELTMDQDEKWMRLDTKAVQLTRQSLCTIATAWPTLESLALPINHSRSSLSPLPVSTQVPTCPNISVWYIGGTDLGSDLDATLDFVLKLFPSICTFYGPLSKNVRNKIETKLEHCRSSNLKHLRPHYVTPAHWKEYHSPSWKTEISPGPSTEDEG